MAVYVIAGGTSGIGRECLTHLAESGNDILAIGTNPAHRDELLESLSPGGRRRVSVQLGDLTQVDTAEAAADFVKEKFPSVDGLVNSAGTISVGGIEAETYEGWCKTLSANLDSAFNLTKALVPALRHSTNPAIVNISSTCSARPCDSISYSVSKAALDMFTRHLSRDLARYRIRVNSVNPGVVETNLQMSAGLFANESTYRDWLSSMATAHPLGVGNVRDVREAVTFLLSPAASWITGTSLYVDGGRAA